MLRKHILKRNPATSAPMMEDKDIPALATVLVTS